MAQDWLGLRGKVCVVTGAGSGIGRGIALGLAAVGARPVVLDLRAEGVAETAALVRAAGGEALEAVCDVTDAAALHAQAAAVMAWSGRCDVLVNNAALVRNAPLSGIGLDDWNAVLQVNLTGFLLCAQAFGGPMRQDRGGQGGSLVHIASIAGTVPQPNSGAYSVSKAGVLMLSRHLATEWAGAGIRSNVVSPAMVVTPMTASIYDDAATRALREKVVPAGRIGQPADIADTVCFLASDRAGYITGQEIVVDGGWSASLLSTVPRPGFDAPAD